MRELEQISRRALVWLLVAQLAVLIPHAWQAPVWLWGVWSLVVVWRWQIFRGAWNYPARFIKVVLVGCCSVLLILSFSGTFAMQFMVCLLLVGFLLKLLEMKRRSDFLLVCYLGYFVIATQFLFSSELFSAAFGLLAIILLTAALLAVNQSLAQQKIFRNLYLGGGLVLQALPFMLLLFVVLPRLGPLWSIPSNTSAAKTGMSNSMSPGDFNELMKSNELAFRATFIQGTPKSSELYWRGLVFSHFDGRRWSQTMAQTTYSALRWTSTDAQEWLKHLSYNGSALHYEIIMEPSYQPWLFSLTAPQEWSDDIGIGKDLWLQKRSPISQRIQYSVTSVLDYHYEIDQLEDWQLRQELSLPKDINPETRKIAQAWRAEAQSPEALIQRLLANFQARFTYTLQPKRLGTHSVDEFLWQTQAGFCEHFASSFVFFMRAAGIPARVVVGYQGGEFNAKEGYWVVRQRDAHAWSEVWLQGKGWVRIDPTAAVAPERIERGIDYSLSEEDSRLLGNALSRNSKFINDLYLRWDAINYNWSRWVLNYDNDKQNRLLEKWLGTNITPMRIAIFVVSVGAVIVLVLLILLMWRTQKVSREPADNYYLAFSHKLARIGMVRSIGEAPWAFAQRVNQQYPRLTEQVNNITQLYEWISYDNQQAALSELASAVRQFSPSKKAVSHKD